MSTRNHKAIFERKAARDEWSAAAENWTEEIHREFVELIPLRGREIFDAQQVQSTVNYTARMELTPTGLRIRPQDRMKIERKPLVDEDEPTADVNFRIFNIENVVNVREQNRTLELMVTEKL